MLSGLFKTVAFFLALSASAADLPNILWITSEDNSAHYMSFMGDKVSKTPRLESLAESGIVYERAFANGPVCAVARTTILNGVYATTLGTQYMRSRHPIPPSFKPYVSYLRERGYFCTNNSKTDYNIKMSDASIWDECSSRAHYKNRPAGSPFFAVFNCEITHESNLFPKKIAKNRADGIIPEVPRVAPKGLVLPPFLPDTTEIRNDIAIYYDCIEALDKRVGEYIDELKAQGLWEDTIVFYYSDHGGILPREKRYLFDTGTHVPLIIYLPKKYAHLGPKLKRCADLVSFADFAPTVLSLAGMRPPENMQGSAFLGEYAAKIRPEYVFAYAERFETVFSVRRALTDGKFRYIRNFQPQKMRILPSEYAFNQQGWKSWREVFELGKTDALQTAYWLKPQPPEEFYNTARDKWEVDNLAGKKEFADKFSAMRAALKKTMLKTRDVGVIPEPMFVELSPDAPVYGFANSASFDYASALEAAWGSSERNDRDAHKILGYLNSPRREIRYWGINGAFCLPESASLFAEKLAEIAAGDESFTNRVFALSHLGLAGDKSAAEKLNAEAVNCRSDAQILFLATCIKSVGGELTPSFAETLAGAAARQNRPFMK